MKTKKITLLFFAGVLCMSSSAKDIYVNAATGDDSKDGGTFENSVQTIEKAYALAENGDVIILKGTFVFEQPVVIEKSGLTIKSVGLEKATLDGDNSTQVLELRSSVTLRNLILTKGYGGDGGILNIPLVGDIERDVKIEDCVITMNEAGNRGGAIWCQTYGLPDKLTINRCAFIGNMSGSHGGAIAFIPEGGPTNKAQLNIYNTTFAHNSNFQGGGGVLFLDGGATNYATINLINVTMANNTGGDNGGNCPGIRFIGSDMTVNIKNSILEGNIASDGNYFDISFVDAPKALTVQNSIIGNVTVNGGTIETSTFVAIGSNINNVTDMNNPVAGLGEFTDNHFPLTATSLAYNFGKVEGLTAEMNKDQLRHTRLDENICSAGAVEFFNPGPDPDPETGLAENIMLDITVKSANGHLTINATSATARIYTISGSLVRTVEVIGQTSTELCSGLYIVHLESGMMQKAIKVVVK